MLAHFLLTQPLAFLAVVLYGSFFEWTLHRYVMHRHTIISYPFRVHALQHHRLFRFDESFHALNEEMKTHVTFSPIDYLILLCINAPLFLGFEWLTGIHIGTGGCAAVLVYLGTFDVLHWCFHVPKGRFFEKHGWYRFIKRHHLLHHRYQDRNLNVVLPIADLVIGTLVRSTRQESHVVLEV